jgi:hypothetical protein
MPKVSTGYRAIAIGNGEARSGRRESGARRQVTADKRWVAIVTLDITNQGFRI